jgi:hypothetical protein
MTSTTFLVTLPLEDDELLALDNIALDIQDALMDEFGEGITVKPWSRHEPNDPTPIAPSPYQGLFESSIFSS